MLLWGFCTSKAVNLRTTRKSFCVSVYGMKLWNSLSMAFKQSPNIKQFKQTYKDMIFMSYKEGENVEIHLRSIFKKFYDVVYILYAMGRWPSVFVLLPLSYDLFFVFNF